MSADGKMRRPPGLGAAGRRLFAELTDGVVYDHGERVIVEKACRTADDLARLERELAGAPLTVAGSTGQVRPHPLLAEVRAFRALLAGLLRQIAPPEGLFDDDEARAARDVDRSSRARRAARARWGSPGWSAA